MRACAKDLPNPKLNGEASNANRIVDRWAGLDRIVKQPGSPAARVCLTGLVAQTARLHEGVRPCDDPPSWTRSAEGHGMGCHRRCYGGDPCPSRSSHLTRVLPLLAPSAQAARSTPPCWASQRPPVCRQACLLCWPAVAGSSAHRSFQAESSRRALESPYASLGLCDQAQQEEMAKIRGWSTGRVGGSGALSSLRLESWGTTEGIF